MERISIVVDGDSLIVIVSGEESNSPTVGPVKTTLSEVSSTLNSMLLRQRELQQKYQEEEKARADAEAKAKVEKKAKAKEEKAKSPKTEISETKKGEKVEQVPQEKPKENAVQSALFSDIE